MVRRILAVSIAITAPACAHKPAQQVAPHVAVEKSARMDCSREAIDRLSPTRRDSARIECGGYRYQTLRIP